MSNPVQFFAVVSHESRGQYWAELVILRRGELVARRCVTSCERARKLADYLADKYSVPADERHGMYVGSIIRTGK